MAMRSIVALWLGRRPSSSELVVWFFWQVWHGWFWSSAAGGGLLVGLRAGAAGEALAVRLRPLRRDDSPFVDDVPSIDAVGTTWVQPRVVVEVRALELTGQHRLRQPAYLGVRTDLVPADLEEVEDA